MDVPGPSDIRKNHETQYKNKYDKHSRNQNIIEFLSNRYDLPKGQELEFCLNKLDNWNLLSQFGEAIQVFFDTYNKTLFKSGKLIPLTKKEALFLNYLISNKCKAVNYHDINTHIWEGNMTQDALRSLIKELRKKTYKELIKNVSGIGYRIDI